MEDGRKESQKPEEKETDFEQLTLTYENETLDWEIKS